MGLFKKEEYLETYLDKNGREFVVLTNDKGISEVKYVRDLIKESFGDTTKYDEIMKTKYKSKLKEEQ